MMAQNEWQRPEDWLELPEIHEGEEKIVGLIHVTPKRYEYIAIKVANDYRVDWGDGCIEEYDAWDVAEHAYDFSQLGPETETTSGMRQAIFTITPQRKNAFIYVDLAHPLQRKNVFIYVNLAHPLHVSSLHTPPRLVEVVMSGPFIRELYCSTIRNTQLRWLQHFKFVGSNSITKFRSMFQGCDDLCEVSQLDMSKGTDFSYMFCDCKSLRWLPEEYISDLSAGFVNVYGEQALQEVTNIIDRFLPTTTFREQEALVYKMVDIMRKYNMRDNNGIFSLEVDPKLLENLLATGGLTNNSDQISAKVRIQIEKQKEETTEQNEETTKGDRKETEWDESSEKLQREREHLRQEARQTAQSIRSTARSAGVGHSTQLGSPYIPSGFAISLKKKLENILRRARKDMSNHYLYRMKHGALDTNRARLAAYTDDDRIFRQFKPSKLNKFSSAVSLIIDQSGSMCETGRYDTSNITVATDLAWALAAAMHNFQCNVEIMGFDVEYTVLKAFDQPIAEWHLKADGGTDPTKALTRTINDLKPFVRKGIECLCIIITDGEWYNHPDPICELNKMGVVTAEFLIDADYVNPHGCLYTFRMEHLLECPKYVEQVINATQTEIRRRIQSGHA